MNTKLFWPLSVALLLAATALPGPLAAAATLAPQALLTTGGLYGDLFGRLLGSYDLEREPDSPARQQERKVRLTLRSDADPQLSARVGLGPVGLQIVASGRRVAHVQSTGTYSLRESDLDGDGIFEVQQSEFANLNLADVSLDHRQNLFFAATVSHNSFTFGLNATMIRSRLRGAPKGSILAWPAPVTTASGYSRSQTEARDLTQGIVLGRSLDTQLACVFTDNDLWSLGGSIAWQGQVHLRLAGAWASEKDNKVGETVIDVTHEVSGVRTNSAVSEQLVERRNYSRELFVGELYIPLRIGIGGRFSLLHRGRNSGGESRRRGAIKDNMEGLATGLLTISRDQVYEWTDTVIRPEFDTTWAVDTWIRTEPWSTDQVGEWLFGAGYEKRSSGGSVEEKLTSTIRDLVNNGNGIEDAGDLFKKGSGVATFRRDTEGAGETFRVWSRVGTTVLEESLLALQVAGGYQWQREKLSRSLLSQQPVVGTITTQVGTSDLFQEPSAFEDLLIGQELVQGSFFATIGGYFEWQPQVPIGLTVYLELNPLAGTGQEMDPNHNAGWLNRFAAEVRYSF